MNQFEIIEKVGISNKNYSEAVKNALKGLDKKIFGLKLLNKEGDLPKMGILNFK